MHEIFNLLIYLILNLKTYESSKLNSKTSKNKNLTNDKQNEILNNKINESLTKDFTKTNKISELTDNDLNSEENFIILIVFEKLNFTCLTCELFKRKFVKHKKNFKLLNFYKNPTLASKFYVCNFPEIFFKYNKKFYYIDFDKIENLIEFPTDLSDEIVINEKLNEFKKINKFLAPTSIFSKIFSLLVFSGFSLFEYFYENIYIVPEKFVISIMCFIILYLIHMLYKIIYRNK